MPPSLLAAGLPVLLAVLLPRLLLERLYPSVLVLDIPLGLLLLAAVLTAVAATVWVDRRGGRLGWLVLAAGASVPDLALYALTPVLLIAAGFALMSRGPRREVANS